LFPYVSAAVFAVLFVKVSDLSRRIGDAPEGRIVIVIGIICTALYLAPRLFMFLLPEQAVYALMRSATYFLYAANILLIYGVARQLLAAQPK
jgi:hypothetical protein